MSDVNNTVDAADTGPATTPDISLTLTDIANAVQVIDFAADNGAFRGWETIEKVLSVRQRLNTFLQAAGAAQAESADETSTEVVEG